MVIQFTGADFRRLVKARLDSHEWWLIPHIGVRSAQACEVLETRHYSGEAAEDFQVMWAVGDPELAGVFGLAMAHKRRLSNEDLAAFYNEFPSASPPIITGDQDVLIFIDADPVAAALQMMRLMDFVAWIETEPPTPSVPSMIHPN